MEGEFVALLGPNGAGKTTLLRALAGLIRPTSGSIRWMGEAIQELQPYEICRRGISFISEDSNLFPGMTVHENLLLGAYAIRERRRVLANMEAAFEMFPTLRDRRNQLAGTLSGGERRMLGLGRGLMAEPRMLFVDEPSLGLAPKIVDTVFDTLLSLNRRGMTILMAEQNVFRTLEMIERAYLLEHGRVVLEGSARDLEEDPNIRQTYLGMR
jgi:branched-chain amino acid transport system ATP-binding protein